MMSKSSKKSCAIIAGAVGCLLFVCLGLAGAIGAYFWFDPGSGSGSGSGSSTSRWAQCLSEVRGICQGVNPPDEILDSCYSCDFRLSEPANQYIKTSRVYSSVDEANLKILEIGCRPDTSRQYVPGDPTIKALCPLTNRGPVCVADPEFCQAGCCH